jgi:hypothetical protein
MQANLLHTYSNGGYQVSMYADGTKIRELVGTEAPRLQEQCDLKITDWCDAGCAWCHEGSTTKGVHADLDRTFDLFSCMPAGTEVAIGGGDPLSHPDFVRFVRALRAQGLVPSVTVNGRHFARHLPVLKRLTSEGSLFGVGFSYHDRLPRWDYEHLVVHLIAGIHLPEVLDEAEHPYKVLLLGYKQFGRGKKLFDVRPSKVQDTIESWYRELFWVAQEHHISFDNLAIDQLKPQRLFAKRENYDRQWMGPEGEFSMYVDAVTQTYALSSYSYERFPWTTMPEMFSNIRGSQGFNVATPSTGFQNC